MIPENIQISKLANGLTFITIDQPWNKGIYCYSLVKVGSGDEQLERDKGICHFLEHMVFRGTEEYTKDDMNKMIPGRGGYFNAATSISYTAYNMWSQIEYLEDSLSVLENLIFKPLISSDSLEIERNIIIEEIMEHESDPSNKAFEKASSLLYPNHNFRFPIAGSQESVKNITATRMKEYLRGYYRPQTTILALCGALPEPDKLEDILYKKAHGFVRKTRGSNSSVLQRNFGDTEFDKNNYDNNEVWENLKSSSSMIAVPYNAKDLFREERIGLNVLSNMVGGYSNSIMFKKIRDDEGLCYSCGCFNTILIDHLGCFSFYFYSRKENIKKADDQLEKILKQICDGKFSEADLEESKNNIVGSMIRNLESGGFLTKCIAGNFMTDDDRYKTSPWEVGEMTKKVTKKQVVELANKIFKNNKSKYTIYNHE